MSSIKDVLEQKVHFLPFHKNHSTGDYFHWITFRLENTGTEPVDLTLNFQSYADSISFFIVEDSGLVSIDSPQSWMTPRSERIYPQYRFAVFNFTLNPKKPVKVLMKVLRTDGAKLVLPLVLFKRMEFEKMYSNDAIFHGFYLGWMLFVSVLSFVFFLFIKEKMYLYYSLSIMFSILNLMSLHGIINLHYSEALSFINGPVSNIIFCGLYFVTTIAFSHLYLDANEYLPKLWQTLIKAYLVLAIILLSLALIKTSPGLWKIMYHLALLYVIIVCVYIGYGLKNRKLSAYYYLIAVVPMFLIGSLYLLSSLGVVRYALELSVVYKLSVLFEILVLSIGLGHRYLIFKREKSKLEHALVQSQHKIIESQETERRRLAKDLHDDLGGTLSAIKGQAANENASQETLSLIEKAIEDLRNVSRNLMPPELEKAGLAGAVYQAVERLRNLSQTEFIFITFGREVRLAADTELNIYRIIGELLNNILKHANASRAVVQLLYYEDHLLASVEDNGVGIETGHENRGIGLKNINSRVEYLKATLSVDTGPCGTTVMAGVPYQVS